MYGVYVEVIFSAGGANMLNPKMHNNPVMYVKASWQMKAHAGVTKPTKANMAAKLKKTIDVTMGSVALHKTNMGSKNLLKATCTDFTNSGIT